MASRPCHLDRLPLMPLILNPNGFYYFQSNQEHHYKIYYDRDIIQRRFWLAAMSAPYLDGAQKNRWKTFRKKKILEKIIIKQEKNEFLNGQGKHY